MTPQIALDLSLDGIAVLSRAEGGVWWREGVVRLDADDMAEGLTKLRARAAARAGDDFTSILIIPDSQLLFTSLERDDRDPKVTIRSLLRGRTPYAVEDLAFDFVQTGDRLQVAVVALETLMEAEEFAASFGFQPIAIMGNPADSAYPGQPHFGQTGIAADILGGAKLVLDVEDGFDVIPAPAPPAGLEPVVPHVEVVAAELPEDPGQDSPPEPVDLEDIAGEDMAASAAEPEPIAPVPDAPDVDLPPASAPPAAPTPVTDVTAPSPEETPDDAPATFAQAMAETEAPASMDPPGPAKAEPSLPTFSTSRRAERSTPPPITDAPMPRVTPRLTAVVPDAPTPPVVTSPAVPVVETAPVKTPVIAAPPVSAATRAKMAAALEAPAPQRDEAPGPPPSDTPHKFGFKRDKTAKGAASPVDEEAMALTLPGLAREKAGTPAKAGGGLRLGLVLTLSLLALMGVVALWSVLQGDTPATDVTGELRTEPATALLRPAPLETEVEAEPEDDLASLLPAPGTNDAVQNSDVILPPVPLVVAEPETETFETAGNFVDSPTLPGAPTVPAQNDLVISSVDPAPTSTDSSALPAVTAPDTGPTPQVPAIPTQIETPVEAVPAEPDAEVAPAAPVELPTELAVAPAEADAAEPEDIDIATAPDPTPAPEDVVPDAAEVPLVAASVEGTVAPGGYTVFAGRPSVLPVQRTSPQTEPLPAVEDPTEDPVAETTLTALPEDTEAQALLRRTRPIERPVSAAPVPDAEVEAEAEIEQSPPPIASGFTRDELTRTRPQQRPQSINDAAAAVDAAAEAARVAAAEERAAAVEAAAAAAVASLASQATASIPPPGQPVAAGSGLALAQSDRPRTRPRSVERDAARIVTQRREQAVPAAAASTARASTPAPPAPAAERSNQTIRSAGGSVARAATQRNAIRLRDINLIGVYGRPNARRALVRLGNGRYVKVEVGDQLDRGRVTAIGENQLVYQRGGRNVALSLPST